MWMRLTVLMLLLKTILLISIDNRNNIACRLISEEFIGSVVTLFLESKDGTEFKVQIQERELVDINFRGDNELIISWEIHNAHLLPELET